MVQHKPSVTPLCEPLQTQLQCPPASSEFAANFHLNALENRTTSLLFLGQELLDSESLVRRHGQDLSQVIDT